MDTDKCENYIYHFLCTGWIFAPYPFLSSLHLPFSLASMNNLMMIKTFFFLSTVSSKYFEKLAQPTKEHVISWEKSHTFLHVVYIYIFNKIFIFHHINLSVSEVEKSNLIFSKIQKGTERSVVYSSTNNKQNVQ